MSILQNTSKLMNSTLDVMTTTVGIAGNVAQGLSNALDKVNSENISTILTNATEAIGETCGNYGKALNTSIKANSTSMLKMAEEYEQSVHARYHKNETELKRKASAKVMQEFLEDSEFKKSFKSQITIMKLTRELQSPKDLARYIREDLMESCQAYAFAVITTFGGSPEALEKLFNQC